MSLDARPAPAVFDPEADELPAVLRQAVSGDAAIVFVVAGPKAREGGWAARVAVAAADAAARRRRVILADLSFEEPELNAVLGMRNREGLADVFLFGASLERVAQRAAGHTFQLVPPGAYVPDPEEILSSSRWFRLAPELADLNTVMLVYVPAGAAGLSDLVRHGPVVVLNRAGDEPEAGLPDGSEIVATVTPPEPDAEDEAAVALSDGVEGDESAATERAAAPEPEPRDAVTDARSAPDGLEADVGLAPSTGVPVEEWVDEVSPKSPDVPVPGSPVDELTIPPVLRPRSPERRRPSPVLWFLLVIVLAVAGWYAYTQYFAPTGQASAAPAPPAAPVLGRPIETEVPVSVSIEVYESLDVAQRRVAALRAAEPDLEFFVSPVLNDGVTYQIVMAGPVANVDAGMALMRRLVQDGYKTAEETWSVRPTTLAFRIQDFDTRAAAVARRDQLAAKGVPTYVVEVPYTVGPSHYRLYAGAYEYRSEAQVMAQLLKSVGINAPLVPRTGRPVA
jgi:Mrp family chromosome partitioning ATPase